MMSVTPTCRYCHRLLTNPTGHDQVAGEPYYTYRCLNCKSIQGFEPNGQCTYWQFQIGNYVLHFQPDIQVFKIIRLAERTDDPLVIRPAALTLHFLPHNLTPQTTTEDRIKTLILFS